MLFDELLPWRAATALRELGVNASHVGHASDKAPPRGSPDEVVLDYARATNQVVVTSNHDMVMLCAEQGEPVIWIDPRGRQFRRNELVPLIFLGIEEWQRLLTAASEPVCLHVMRTKTEVLSLDRARALVVRRMRTLKARQRTRTTKGGGPELGLA